MITERVGIWATLLVAIGTAVAAYAKVKSDTAVALEKVDTVAETIRRLDQKIEVINTTAERVAKVEGTIDTFSSDMKEIKGSLVRMSEKVEGINSTVHGLSTRQQDIIDRVKEVRRKLDRR